LAILADISATICSSGYSNISGASSQKWQYAGVVCHEIEISVYKKSQ